jgi:hypothetical protein
MRFTLSAAEKTKLSEIFGADLRSLAALRIGVGLLILYDLFAAIERLGGALYRLWSNSSCSCYQKKSLTDG